MKKRINTLISLLTVITLVVAILPTMSRSVAGVTTLKNPKKVAERAVIYDCIYFGSYPQSDITGEKKDPIKWRVLSVNGNDAFLVADKNLDVMWYNQYIRRYDENDNAFDVEVTWENCTLRKWLNSDFSDRAFTPDEQSAIIETELENKDNSKHGTPGGNNTIDKVFILSAEEISNPEYGFEEDYYYDCDYSRQRLNTPYVANGGSLEDSDINTDEGRYDEVGEQWVRTPGNEPYMATFITINHSCVEIDGMYVNSKSMTVCPSIHLDLSRTDLWTYAGTIDTCPWPYETKGDEENTAVPSGASGENGTTRQNDEPTVSPDVLPATKEEGNLKKPTGENKTKATEPKKNLKKVAVKTKVLKGNKVKLTWKKVAGVAGYQIMYGTNKKITKNKKSFVIKGSDTTSKIIRKLSQNTYYFKVRGFIKQKKKKVYGKWSNTKKIKIN